MGFFFFLCRRNQPRGPLSFNFFMKISEHDRLVNLVEQLQSLAAAMRREVALLNPHNNLSPMLVKRVVAHGFDISQRDLVSKSRVVEVCWPRQVAMFLMREVLRMKLTAIAHQFNKDHGTVISALTTVRARMDTEPLVAQKVEQLRAFLMRLNS